MFINLKDWRKLFMGTQVEDVKQEKESQDCEYFFNRMVCVEHFKGYMNAKVTEEGFEKLKNFTLNELFVYFHGFLDSHQIETEYNLSSCGSVTKTSNYLAFKSLVSCVLDLLKQHMKIEEGDKNERSDNKELCPENENRSSLEI